MRACVRLRRQENTCGVFIGQMDLVEQTTVRWCVVAVVAVAEFKSRLLNIIIGFVQHSLLLFGKFF